MTSRDETALYSLAASCRLQEDDPQPPRRNVGIGDDPRMVHHVEAWRDFYSRTLVEKLGAEPERLDGAALGCRAASIGSAVGISPVRTVDQPVIGSVIERQLSSGSGGGSDRAMATLPGVGHGHRRRASSC